MASGSKILDLGLKANKGYGRKMFTEGGVDARMHLICACGSVVLLVQELSAQGWESRKP